MSTSVLHTASSSSSLFPSALGKILHGQLQSELLQGSILSTHLLGAQGWLACRERRTVGGGEGTAEASPPAGCVTNETDSGLPTIYSVHIFRCQRIRRDQRTLKHKALQPLVSV